MGHVFKKSYNLLGGKIKNPRILSNKITKVRNQRKIFFTHLSNTRVGLQPRPRPVSPPPPPKNSVVIATTT